MGQKIKTVQTSYLVKVNNDVVDTKPTLREARQLVKLLTVNDDVNSVFIIKQTLNETVLDIYHTRTTKVLVASQLDEGME